MKHECELWAEQAPSYEAGGCDPSVTGWAFGFADLSQALSSFRSWRNGPYALKVFSLNSRLAPQLRQTWYEYPCPPIGQLILPCQQPRKASTAAPARLLATTPSHHQLDLLSFSGFSCSTGSFITTPGRPSTCSSSTGQLLRKAKSE